MNTRNRKGFTLIEILIVVIILGILAAIVIPQFTNASKEAKQSSLVTMVQSLRSQIALFKLQHNDYLPGAAALTGSGGTFNSDVFWGQLTEFTDVTGARSTAKTDTYDKGPYMQSIPKNPLCPTAGNESIVADGTDAAAQTSVVGFVYDYNGGAGSGKIWGTNTDGLTPIPQ